MQQYEIDWIDYIVDKAYKFYNNRKIVIWGSYTGSENIGRKLKEKYQIDIAFFVDSDVTKIDNRSVYPTDYLLGKASECYVIIPLGVYSSIKNLLHKGGYKEDLDYYYFSDCIVRQENDYYEDRHGNKIIGNYQGLKFVFSGFGSIVKIGSNVKFLNTSFYIHNNSQITIGDENKISDTTFYFGDNSKSEFGENIRILKTYLCMENSAHISLASNTCLMEDSIHLFQEAGCRVGCKCHFQYMSLHIGEQAQAAIGKEETINGSRENRAVWSTLYRSMLEIAGYGKFEYGTLHLQKNASLVIGQHFTIERNYNIHADTDTLIKIGDDCMFSSDILLRSNDGHAVFDIISGENINSSSCIRKNRKLVIGNHVWVAMRSAVMYGAKLEDSSIIGPMSMVKSEIPNNCMAEGVPAKIIRRNVTWNIEECSEDISECMQEYIQLTQE